MPRLQPDRKPALINIKKLYRFDADNQAFKVCKSKLIRESSKKPAQTSKKRGPKSRFERNIPFLLMDLFKPVEFKAKNARNCGFSLIFDEVLQENRGFSIVKTANEEKCEKKQEFFKKINEKRRFRDVSQEKSRESASFSQEKARKLKKIKGKEQNIQRNSTVSQEKPAENSRNEEIINDFFIELELQSQKSEENSENLEKISKIVKFEKNEQKNLKKKRILLGKAQETAETASKPKEKERIIVEIPDDSFEKDENLLENSKGIWIEDDKSQDFHMGFENSLE